MADVDRLVHRGWDVRAVREAHVSFIETWGRPPRVAGSLAQAFGAPVAFSDPDCAFDIRASVAGGTATWTGVNLCGTSRVTLQRRPSGETWVDYD